MVTPINGKTINEVAFKAHDKIIKDGHRTPSRNGDISTIYNAFLTIENPKSRHLGLVGRKSNIFATYAEIFWVFAGSNKIDPYLSFFLPRAKDFSDDGETWRGGYPERIRNNDQIQDVMEQFRNEGIFTRRAVIYIGDPNLDTYVNLKEKYGIENTKDRPCFEKNTEILTNNGYKKITDVKPGDLVYSYSEETENMELNKVLWSGKTATVDKMIKITLSDGSQVRCTPDHPVYVKKYSYSGKARQPYEVLMKDAQDLEEGEYILSVPVHEKRGEIKINLRKNKSFNNLSSFHRDTYEYYFGEIPEGMVIHHKNGNHFDNSKDNLELMTIEEYNALHRKENNPMHNNDTKQKKSKLNERFPGYSHGLQWKDYSNEDILDLFSKRIEELETLSYDWCNKNLTSLNFPSLTRIVKKFGSWKSFKEELKEKLGEHPIFERKKKGKTDQSRRFIKVVSVEVEDVKEDVYDITVENNHNFVLKSGGWIVHNCNMVLTFFVTPDKKLHMNAVSRSGDVIWGALGVNAPEWCFMQEMITQYVQQEIDPEVTLGTYNHLITNLHLYDFNGSQAYDVLENWREQKLGLWNTDNIDFPDVDDVHDFFGELVGLMSEVIEAKTYKEVPYGPTIQKLKDLFKKYMVEYEGNTLALYAEMTLHYIYNKRHLEKFDLDVSGFSEEIFYALKISKFRHFPIIYDGMVYDELRNF